MKGKQLALLLLLALILGAAGYYLYKGNSDTWAGSSTAGGAGSKVIDLPINDVARLVIKNSSSELNLVKKDDTWIVQERADYPASYEQVSGLLLKLWNLKSVQEVKAGPSQFSRLDLVEPDKGNSTRLEFKDKDGKQLAALLLGKQYVKKGESDAGDMPGLPSGRYVLPVGEGSKVSLVSESLIEVTPSPESWLKRDFIKVENPKTITLAGATDAQKWKLSRETATADWKLDGAKEEEKVDTAKTGPIASSFAMPSFTDVMAPDAKPEETGLDKPTVVTIETFDQFTYTLKIGKQNAGNYPVIVEVAAALPKERAPGKDEKPEDKTKLDEEFKTTSKRLEDKLATEQKFTGRPFLIASFTIEQMLKDRTALLVEKKPETPPVSATTPPVSATTPPVGVPPTPAPEPVPQPPSPTPAPTPAPEPVPPAPAPAPQPPAPAPGPQPPVPLPTPQPPTSEPAPQPPAPAPVPQPPSPAPGPQPPVPLPTPQPPASEPAPQSPAPAPQPSALPPAPAPQSPVSEPVSGDSK